MNVLIKGMEMPKEGNETIIRILPDGTVLDQYGHHIGITATPIPPHGRLIDADVLIGKVNNGYYCEDLCQFVYAVGEQEIKDEPTVIEAEEEK